MITVNGLRKQLLQLQLLLRQTLMTDKQKQDVLMKIDNIRDKLQDTNIEYDISSEQIQNRRNILNSNEGLKDIFKTFWNTCRIMCDSDTLDKDTYIKLFTALQHALLGYCQDDDAIKNAELDYNLDIAKFGEINETRFNDVLFNFIDYWCEFIEASYVTVFTWTLLDAVIDIKSNPPKFRTLREIKRLTKVQNEAGMYENYLSHKNTISKLVIEHSSLDRVASVQKRFLARKATANFSGNRKLMLEALISRHTKLNIKSSHGDMGDSSSDSDDNEDDANDELQEIGTNSMTYVGSNTMTSDKSGGSSTRLIHQRIVLPFAKSTSYYDKHYMKPLDGKSLSHRNKVVRVYTDKDMSQEEYIDGPDLHSYMSTKNTEYSSGHHSFDNNSFLQVVNLEVKNEPKEDKRREIIQYETGEIDRPYSRPLQNLEPITIGLLPGSRSSSRAGSQTNTQLSQDLGHFDQVDQLLAAQPTSPISSPSSSPITRTRKELKNKSQPLMKVTQIDTKRMNLWSYSSYDLDLIDDDFFDNDDDLSFGSLSTYSTNRLRNAALNTITEKARVKINQPDMAAISKHPVTFPHDVFHDYVTVSLSSSEKVAASSQAWSHARAAKTIKSLPFHLQQRCKISEKQNPTADDTRSQLFLSPIGLDPPRPNFAEAKTNLRNRLKEISGDAGKTINDDDVSIMSHDSDMISFLDQHVDTLISDSNSLGTHSLLSKVHLEDNDRLMQSVTNQVQTSNDSYMNEQFVESYSNIGNRNNNRNPESSNNYQDNDAFTVYDGLLKERKRLIEKRIIALHRIAKLNMGYKPLYNNSSVELSVKSQKVKPFSRTTNIDGKKYSNNNYANPDKYEYNFHSPNKDDDDDDAASMASTISSLTYLRKEVDHSSISSVGGAAIATYRGRNTKLKSNNLLAHLDGKYRHDASNNRNKNDSKIDDGDSLDLSVNDINSRKQRKGVNNDNPVFVITSKSKSSKNMVKANATSPELSSNYGNDDNNSIKSLVSSISSQTLVGGQPWLPHPNVMNKSNSYIIHKSDRNNSWKDNMLMLNYSPVNPALTLTTVKCQDSVKEVFEMYSRKKYAPSNRLLMPSAKRIDIKIQNASNKRANK